MKSQFRIVRTKETLKIPSPYLQKNADMQNRRELTFLMQEAAYLEYISLYNVVSLEQLAVTDQKTFTGLLPSAKSVVYIGIPINDPFLCMEQLVSGVNMDKYSSMAEARVEVHLRNYAEKLELQGYQCHLYFPNLLPDLQISKILSLSKAGFVGKNNRFITEANGCRVCIGYVVTTAPLMGDDYRYPHFEENLCGTCDICEKNCPASAICNGSYSKEICLSFRNEPKHQLRVAEHSILKCDLCMRYCPIGMDNEWGDQYSELFKRTDA